MRDEPDGGRPPRDAAVAQLFPPWATLVARLALVSGVLLPFCLVGLLMALQYTPYVTGQTITPEQTVPFSHEHHVGGLGIECRYCHTSVEKSRFAGLPPTHTCMTCHSQLWTNAAVLEPVRRSLAEDRPIRWRRVNALPDYVYFDHSIHVAKGVGCTSCHGPVDTMPLMRQAVPLTMGWCLDCHRNPAPHLRPEGEIFAGHWSPPADQDKRGAALIDHYGISTEHLADCSVCHQ
ncbi:cytochrome c3 family protein [Dankookia sp. P2]|uniref:cytochrome c3 family protein n=1 Tax=Dankookia sp. P2 TaxID=3423955 RepID=UPI003D66B92C